MIETLVSIVISCGIISVVVMLVIRAVRRARITDKVAQDDLYDGVPYDVYSGKRGGFRGSFERSSRSSFDGDRQ